jgi:hypothetical protein
MSKNEYFWIGFSWFLRAFLATTFLLIGLGYLSGCGGTGDRTNCMETDCRDTDAGMPDADPTTDPDGNTTPDGDTPPDSNNDLCSQFQQPSPAGRTWYCMLDSGTGGFECGNPTFANSGACTTTGSDACCAMCNDGSTAGEVRSSELNMFTTDYASYGGMTCGPLFQN